MVGENYEDQASHASNLVVKEENVENKSLVTESQEVVEEPSTFVEKNLVEEDFIENEKYESNSEPFAPTKPLPPEPADMANDSEEDENKMETKSTSSESSSDSDVKDAEEERRKSSDDDKELKEDLLEPLDEYDKHPVPESVEFLNSNKDYQEEEVLCNNDASPNVQEIPEETSNNDDNTSPSQDSSFQMLDMGSDSDAGKGLQDEVLSESKNADSLIDVEDTIIDYKDNDDSMATEKNEATESSLVQSLVQFTDNSNVDSQEQPIEQLADINSERDEDKLRQTSKEFVDELMEEALNITSEHKLENECLNQQEGAFDDADEEEDHDDEDDKSSGKSSPQTSPRDLMEDLLDSVPPPSSSPPQDASDKVMDVMTEAKQAVDQEQFIVEGEIKIENEELKDNNELERLLSDAQKDDPAILEDNNITNTEVLEEIIEPKQKLEENIPVNDDLEIYENERNGMSNTPKEAMEEEKDVSDTEAIEGKIVQEEANTVDITDNKITEEEPIVGIYSESRDRKDSSSDYDEEDDKDEEEVERKVEENQQINRTISSDYEDENQDDDKSTGDNEIEDAGEKKRTQSSSSEYEEENDDVGDLVKNEPTTKHKLSKRDSSSDYDEGNDNDAAEDHESSDSEIKEEVDIKTKTLADMDEGDPWSEKEKEPSNEKVSCSEYSEDKESDGLPAQDDMSHRAVFGDDDDRNDEDVLLLDENEDEVRERENENRKLSTTVPSLMEENESMGLKDVKDNLREDIEVKSDEEGKQEEPVSTSDLLTDKSLEAEVESAIEAKECQDISEDIEGLLLESDVSKKVKDALPEASPTNFTSSISEAKKEESLIDF